MEKDNKFKELFSIYYKRYVNFAWSYIKNDMAAEDIVMESMIYYWENRENLSNQDNIPAFILCIVKNKCLNYLKHEKVKQFANEKISTQAKWDLTVRLNSLEMSNPDELLSKELQGAINKALSELPKKTRDIFILSRYENKSHNEISIQMNLSCKSVEYHLSKATKYLRKALKDYLYILFMCYF